MNPSPQTRPGRVRGFVRRRPVVSLGGAAAVVAIGAWLFFGFFGFHTLFFDETVDEANPFVAGPGPSGLAVDETSPELADEINKAMDELGIEGDTQIEDTMVDAPEVTTVSEGTFIDRAHPTRGTARIITDGDRSFLRLEGFETDNGPDLNVYLATGDPTGSPGDFVDLGDLKGNVGDQNYEIDPDVVLDEYTTVFIWCVRFGVAFGAAALA
jgi:hypothetical protein